MTKEELMIGDWAMNTHNRKPEQVCEVRYVHELQHALRLCGVDKELIVEE